MTRRFLWGVCIGFFASKALATFVFNNGVPFVPDEWPLSPGEDALYQDGTAWMLDTDTGNLSIGGVGDDFVSADHVTDPESDDLTWSEDSGAIPDGTCGTHTFTLRAEDPYGDGVDLSSEVLIGEVVPDVEDVAEATAVSTIEALCSLTTVDGGDICSVLAEGNVARTSPVIGTLVEADAAITYFLSSGQLCGGGGLLIDVGVRIQ